MFPFTTLVRHDLAADITVMRVSGPLNLRNGVQLRSALLKCVSECPTAVVVDVSECVPETPALLSVFPTVARTHGQPQVAIILCGADREFRRAGTAALGPIRAYQDCADAMATAADVRLRQPRVSIRLLRSVSAPGRARNVVDQACDTWGLVDLKTSALLIISELVTNAVRHAAGDIDVEAVLREDFLHLRVSDGSTAPPAMVTSPDGRNLRECGRGLQIIERYCTGWGFVLNPSGTGKVVWATLRAAPPGAKRSR
jgi:anti-sigma regulatory factor (Ser/Thr protein kinase)